VDFLGAIYFITFITTISNRRLWLLFVIMLLFILQSIHL